MNSQISQTPLEEEEESNCKLCFLFNPPWTHYLPTRRVFASVYAFLCIVQGMGFLYIISAMTTMELHFQLPSEIFGVVMSVGEVLAILSSFIVGLLVGVNCHRPRAIAIGMSAMGIGYNLYALPYYLYGPPKLFNLTYNNNSHKDVLLCQEYLVDNSTVEADCKTSLEAPDGVSVSGITALVLLAYTTANVGWVLLYVIGTPFLDDNVQSKDSPMYIAAMSSFRTLGPIFGTVLCSLCLSFYVDPQNPPWFDNNDVRWVGAWWIGYVFMGCLNLLGALMVAQFPRNLVPSKKMEIYVIECNTPTDDYEKTNKTEASSIKEMVANLRRILVNSLLWWRILSEVFTWFGLEGYMLYLPKYLEHEFQMTSSSAGMWAGCSFIIPSLIGNLVVGYVIIHFKLNVRQLALSVAIAKLIESTSMIALSFIQCEDSHLLGSGSSFPVCSWSNCDCSSAIFSPICGSDGFSYFSACHAGCSNSPDMQVLTNCSCIMNYGIAESGLCIKKCPSKYFYLILVAMSKFGLSFGTVAGPLFLLRCVKPRDKTLATGFFCAILGIFTFIPCPLVFSTAIDWSCLVWSKQCGRKGACDIYDMEKFRSILHVAPILLISIGAFWDLIFWYFCKGKIKLFNDQGESGGKQTMKNDVISECK